MRFIMLEKSFDFAAIEPKITERSKPIIAATTKKNFKDETFTITLPPPNVTGSLHLGHAFTSTLQDVLLRFKRQHGYITLGQPGLDHAGIATQIIVANQLRDQGIHWRDLGREKFIEKVWEWKQKSGGMILNQLVRMGMSVDLDRVRFTMDEDASLAVLHAFTTLYKDGLIFRAKRLVNWDPVLKTAVSDLEVSSKQEKGKLWYIRYKIENDPGFITVATTRPETLFGDVAVAVHPDDERYKDVIGKRVLVPLLNKYVPVIADAYSDPTKGSGAVKITPAHDFNDFEVGRRHDLPVVDIMDESGHMNGRVPEAYQWLTKDEARTKVLRDLAMLNLLEKEEDLIHAVPYNDRSGAMIEPRMTDQWFLDTPALAKRAIQAVESGQIKFVPDAWKNTYFDWLNRIQPWCISRQIWWGHQIPVWYAPNGKMFCALTEEEAQQQAAAYFGVEKAFLPRLTRDPDVLDTWFSSGLWPFTTLGWPKSDEELKRYYPTDVLVTGFDIIFFWVSRMIMFSLHLLDQIPFKTIYINPLVRDAHGQKMSKSKGNVIDPLELMDQYGTDALRFTLTLLAIPGRDIRISAALVENSRNFMTKIWNAAKFLEMNECACDKGFDLGTVQHPLNVWIVHKLTQFKRQAFEDLEHYRFDYYAQGIQNFLKEAFCDIYIEGAKAFLSGEALSSEDLEIRHEVRQTAARVFGEFLKVAHATIPFITEHLWETFGASEGMLLTEPWGESWAASENFQTQRGEQVEAYVNLIEEIRSLRGLVGLPPAEKLELWVKADDTFLEENQAWIKPLCRLKSITVLGANEDMPQAGICFVKEGSEFCLKYPEGFDVSKTKTVFEKKVQTLEDEINRLALKIKNLAYKDAKPEQWEADCQAKVQKENDWKKMKAMKI